jgi:1-acyl-sn-glycerol-3-phosphate acyltransferase
MKLFEILFGVWATIGALGSALIIGTIGVLPFAPLPRGRRERITIKGAQVWARVFMKGVLFSSVERTGAVDLPDEQGALVVCNHRSWMDPPLLISELRSNGLSKHVIFWIPFVGVFGYLTGAVFFNRKKHEDRARARHDVLHLLRSGCRIQLFPEGTRSKNGDLAEKVHMTLVKDCFGEGIPVIPCAVNGTEEVLPPGRFAARPGKTVQLAVADAMWPKDYPNADAFASAVWTAVRQRFDSIR